MAASALLGCVAWWLLRDRAPSRLGFAGLSLVLAGGLGNPIDRLTSGVVVDFVSAGVADLAITSGALLVAFAVPRPGAVADASEAPE